MKSIEDEEYEMSTSRPGDASLRKQLAECSADGIRKGTLLAEAEDDIEALEAKLATETERVSSLESTLRTIVSGVVGRNHPGDYEWQYKLLADAVLKLPRQVPADTDSRIKPDSYAVTHKERSEPESSDG